MGKRKMDIYTLNTIEEIAYEKLSSQFLQVCRLIRQLSKEEKEEIYKFVKSMIEEGETKKDINEIDYSSVKEWFLKNLQLKSIRTKKFYNNALTRLEEFLKLKNITGIWEINDNEITKYVKYYLNDYKPPVSISTIKRDLSAFSTFYSYIENVYLIRPNPFRKKSIPVREEIQKFKKHPKQIKNRIPGLFEIEKICQNINNKSTLFAVNIAYLYGYLPKDIIEIYQSKIIFKNGQENELTTDLKKLSKYWLKEIEDLKISFYGDTIDLMDKLNTIIFDRFRKHTKNMMNNGELEFPYTLADIKKYFTYNIARIEKVNSKTPHIFL